MDYKLYKIHHSRGKSDTNFYQEQNILNGAYSSLNVLRVSLVSELTYLPIRKKAKKSSRNVILSTKSSDTKEKEKKDEEEIKQEEIAEINGKKF